MEIDWGWDWGQFFSVLGGLVMLYVIVEVVRWDEARRKAEELARRKVADWVGEEQ